MSFMGFVQRFASKKLLVTLLGLLTATLGINIDPSVQEMIVQLVLAYVGGQSVVDSVIAFVDKKKE